MKIRFNKYMTVDLWDYKLNEVVGVSYNKNQIVEVSSVDNDGKFSDVCLIDGNVIQGIPNNSFETITS